MANITYKIKITKVFTILMLSLLSNISFAQEIQFEQLVVSNPPTEKIPLNIFANGCIFALSFL